MPSDFFAGLESSGDPPTDVQRFLEPRRPDTWRHVKAVAATAMDLAARFGTDARAAEVAGYCHDLAAVVPQAQLLAVARAWQVPLSATDRAIPQVIHGPLAAAVIRERLEIIDDAILNAVRYHTTLRGQASALDKVIFIADKVAYDPTTLRLDYLPALRAGLEQSLEAAAYAYLDFIVAHQAELGWEIHPRVVEAHRALGRWLADQE